MIQVVNKYTHKPKAGAYQYYIGRPSPLGNPFPESRYGRDRCVEMYREWLIDEQLALSKPDVVRELHMLAELHKSGTDIDLICFCAPLRCHGDIVKEAVEILAAM